MGAATAGTPPARLCTGAWAASRPRTCSGSSGQLGERKLLYRFSSYTSHDFGPSDQFANFALCILPALLFRNMNRCMFDEFSFYVCKHTCILSMYVNMKRCKFDEFSFYLLLTPSDCARSILNNISTM